MAVVVVLVAAAIVVGVAVVGVVVVCGSRVGTMATTMEAVGGRHLKIVGFGFASNYRSTSCSLYLHWWRRVVWCKDYGRASDQELCDNCLQTHVLRK